MKIGIVSGYWNPLHAGHVEYINAAKFQCEYLIVIVNNDLQVKLKGSSKFMNLNHRCFIMENLKNVDCVYPSIDQDQSVSRTIESIHDHFKNCSLIFFNSGDIDDINKIRELETCKKLSIEIKILDLPKIYSSSELLKGIL